MCNFTALQNDEDEVDFRKSPLCRILVRGDDYQAKQKGKFVFTDAVKIGFVMSIRCTERLCTAQISLLGMQTLIL